MPGTGPPCGGAEGVIVMRRFGVIVALSALLGMFGAVVTAAPALARGPKWQFVPAEPFTLDASFCGFDVGVTFPVDKGFAKALKAADGSMTFLSTGSLRASLTNLETGKTITENVSGPSKLIVQPDGSATFLLRGRGLSIFEPADAARFGLPTVAVVAGAGTLTIAPDGTFTSFSGHGHVVVDLCAALS
jgi:hypothetical protein